MNLCPQLGIDSPMHCEHKMTKTIPSPGFLSKAKSSTVAGQNQVLESTNADSANNTLSSKKKGLT